MQDNTQLKLYVWSGPIRLVGHFDSPMDSARKLFRRIMDADRVDEMDDVIEVSHMGFEASTIRFDAGQVLMTMNFLSFDE